MQYFKSIERTLKGNKQRMGVTAGSMVFASGTVSILQQVVKVKIARDFGHQKIFWDFTKGATRPPGTLLRQLHEVKTETRTPNSIA